MNKKKVLLHVVMIIFLLFSFKVYSSPTLIHPSENMTVTDTTVKLIWHNDALRNVRSNYLLEISENRTFEDPLISIRTERMEKVVTLNEGIYFWRISRFDRTTLRHSVIFRFIVSPQAKYPEENEYQKNIRLQQEKIEELNKKLSIKEKKFIEIKNNLKSTQNQNQEFVSRLNDLQSKYNNVLEENQALRKRVEVALKDSNILRNISRSKEEDTRRLSEYSQTIKKQEAALLKTDKVLQDLNEEVIKLNNDLFIAVQESRVQRENYEAKIKELEERLAAHSDVRGGNQEIIAELNRQIDRLKNTNDQQTKQIIEYRSQLQEIEQKEYDNKKIFAEYSKLLEEGNKHFIEGNFQLAETSFRKALSLYDKDDAVFYNLAVLYYNLNYNEHALDRISRALSLNPNSIDNIILKLSTLIKLNNEEQIRSFISEIRQKNISDTRIERIINNYLRS